MAALERNRFTPPLMLTTENEALYGDICAAASELERLYTKLAPGRGTSLALTNLEQSVMWARKHLETQTP